jgi:hypothetical protein
MHWLLGCLSLVFIGFGGCVFVASLLAFPSASDTGFLAGASAAGGLILLFGIWVLYKAMTARQTPPGADPPPP